jgi:hypothetical protein
MTTEQNTAARARCCRADLCFLRSFLANGTKEREEIECRIQVLSGNPTDEQINAAWKIAAIIHDEIRRK